MVDDAFLIEMRMGNTLVKNMRDKFNIERDYLQPQLSTLPIESVRTKDFAKEYEE